MNAVAVENVSWHQKFSLNANGSGELWNVEMYSEAWGREYGLYIRNEKWERLVVAWGTLVYPVGR